MTERRVIGEGSYGCVIKPSLRCEQGQHPSTYANTVAKIMERKSAKEEYDETEKISMIDGIDQYTLTKPHFCKPAINDSFRSAMNKCDGKRIVRHKNTDMAGLRLLVLEDGGLDLYHMEDTIIQYLSFPDLCIFLTNITNLIEGVAFFVNNGIIHHDIKGDNIVYNIETGRLKFIDFGLMMWRDDFISKSVAGTNRAAMSHSYYPPESSCGNKKTFKSAPKCSKYRAGFSTYKKFIEKSGDTFDSYCLANALSTTIQKIVETVEFERSWVPIDFWKDIEKLLAEFSDKNIANRRSNLDDFLSEYIGILKQYGVFNAHKPAPHPDVTSLSKSITSSKSKRDARSSRNSSSKKARLSTLETQKKVCPTNKELNPYTNKCVRKCRGSRQYRDKRFRCVTRARSRPSARSVNRTRRRR